MCFNFGTVLLTFAKNTNTKQKYISIYESLYKYQTLLFKKTYKMYGVLIFLANNFLINVYVHGMNGAWVLVTKAILK